VRAAGPACHAAGDRDGRLHRRCRALVR
jgi:hypothetical protein